MISRPDQAVLKAVRVYGCADTAGEGRQPRGVEVFTSASYDLREHSWDTSLCAAVGALDMPMATSSSQYAELVLPYPIPAKYVYFKINSTWGDVPKCGGVRALFDSA